MATPMTAGQLERFAQAHRRVSEAGRDRPRPARRLTWGPAGDLDYQIRAVLPAEAAAVVFQALRAARNDLEHPHDDRDHGDGEHDHAGNGDSDVSAADPGIPRTQDRCHLQDGPAISPAALALISCNATISTMIHDLSGAITDVGRRTRKPPPALRRALRERDRGRCQYPGCASRRTDAHTSATGPTAARRTWPTSSASAKATTDSSTTRLHHRRHRHRLRLLHQGRHPGTRLPATPARPRRHHHRPPRRHHPHHHQPPALRRAPQPLPGHLDHLRQRPHPSRPRGYLRAASSLSRAPITETPGRGSCS